MSKEYVLGTPGAAPKLEDVVRVVKGAKCELDQTAASRIKKESPQPSAFKAEDTPPQPAAPADPITLTAEQGKAAVFALLLALVNGKTRIRVKVVEKLLELLNGQLREGVVAHATDSGVMGQLAVLLTASSSSDPLPISAEERAVLTAGNSATAGVGAVAVVAAKRLQQLASVTAALTAETVQADVRDFDVERIEAVCAGEALEVAADLRGLLNESTRVNARKGGAGAVSSVSLVPSVHGELDVVAKRAEQLINAQLKSAPSDPALTHRLGPAYGLPSALSQLTALLDQAARLSLERTQLVGGGLKDATWLEERLATLSVALGDSGAAPSTEGFRGAVTAWEAATRLRAGLALEAAAALASLAGQGVQVKKTVAGAPSGTESKPKKGKGAAGAALGVGTERFYALLSEKASLAATASEVATLSVSDGSGPQVSARNSGSDAQALLEFFDPWSEVLVLELQQLQQHAQSRAKLRKPKVAKGARDFMPDQMAIRELAFSTISAAFERHGAVSIDTPVFELKETLTGKYGEDSKLIYDLKDQGGELLSLRYDLTVPFARYVALYGITSIKRYHIAKVYRRDQPQMTRGRYREFYQCDFDVAGNSPLMVADSEVLKVLTEILSELDLGAFVVKINHRRLLDGMMSLCGVPQEKFRTICSAIDKLDKEPWDAVRTEMVEEKGLDPAAADKIGEFVGSKGAPLELLKQLAAPGHAFAQHPACSAALQELGVLFELLDMMGALHHFSFDLSLARGLDYYTGVIYEAVLEGGNVGSIAAGGRYDNLVGMFSNKPVPAVGVSLGIERIFSILEQKFRAAAADSGGTIRETKTQVLVMSASKDMQPERMRLASELWSSGVAAEFTYKANPFMPEQMSYATSAGIPLGVVLRPDELKQGKVELMETQSGLKEEVGRDEVVAVIQARLRVIGPCQLVVSGRSEAAPHS